MKKLFSVIVLAGLMGSSSVAVAGHGGAVHPDMVDITLAPGESLVVEKTVTTPTIPPKPDIYFLADTTGSMGPAIAGVQASAAAVLAAIDGATTDPRYGAGDYKDFQSPVQSDPYAFLNAASIPGADDNGAAALAAIGAWAAGGGVDGSEGQFFALDRIADNVVGYRPDATKIVVWFGDAPAHDPVCAAIQVPPTGADITEAVNFTETISVDPSVPEGSSVHCTVTFYANSYPEEGTVIGEEMIWIKVPDRTPPKAECVETVNPHGQTVPPAGKTTLPGPKGGQNEDGFYQLNAADNLPGVEIWVKDTGSGTLFGSFASGTRIKYIEANGAIPSQTPMAGNNGGGSGQSTAVDWQIKGTGDAAMIAIDAAGNKTEVACLVPPPPK